MALEFSEHQIDGNTIGNDVTDDTGWEQNLDCAALNSAFATQHRYLSARMTIH